MPDLSERFEQMYKTHYKMLRNAAENIVGDSDAAHDVVQEVFVKLWHRKDELGIILNEKAYLFKSVINAAITHLGHSRKKTALGDIALETSGHADTNLMAKELQGKIQLALDALPPKCKAIFVLSRFEGMKNKEIAATLGLSLKTVENQMGIALKKMRDDLKPYMNDELFCLIFLVGAVAFLYQSSHLLSY